MLTLMAKVTANSVVFYSKLVISDISAVDKHIWLPIFAFCCVFEVCLCLLHCIGAHTKAIIRKRRNLGENRQLTLTLVSCLSYF